MKTNTFMKKINYCFMSNVMVTLLDIDRLNTYGFLASELSMSKTTVSGVKKGNDMPIHNYVNIINYVSQSIHFVICTAALLRQIRRALKENRNLVVGTIPRHSSPANIEQPDWEVVGKWD